MPPAPNKPLDLRAESFAPVRERQATDGCVQFTEAQLYVVD